MVVLESEALWLTYYFAANLGLTIHNKWTLSTVKFEFPWLLTSLHIFISGIGAAGLVVYGKVCKPASLSYEKLSMLVIFSFLYTVNIAISNVSLRFVSLSLHQLIRSTCPMVNLILDYFISGKYYSVGVVLSMIPVIAGICLATMGEYRDIKFDYLGIILTFLGVFLAALKTIVTNKIMVGPLKLHPLDFLYKMTPFALVQCLFYSFVVGEPGDVRRFFGNLSTKGEKENVFIQLLVNGILAFFLNWVSFTANKKTSPLTMAVAGNVKQAMSVMLAVYIFNTPLTMLNIIGIVITLCGGFLYSYLTYKEQVQKESFDHKSSYLAEQKMHLLHKKSVLPILSSATMINNDENEYQKLKNIT